MNGACCSCEQVSEMLQEYLGVVMETVIEATETIVGQGHKKVKKKGEGEEQERKKNPWNQYVKICKPQGKSFSECAVEYHEKKAAGEL